MTAAPSLDDWPGLIEAHVRYRERYEPRADAFRERLSATLDREIALFARSFCGADALSAKLEPVTRHLHDYLLWLRWSAWLSTTLAPPLRLEAEVDAFRLSIATLTYLGARLVDDGMDDHRTFKGKTDTLVGRLATAYPEIDPVVLRCQSALMGFSVLHHGLRRLRSAGFVEAAEAVSRLFGRVAPGIVAETFCDPAALTGEEYRQIILRKSVSYDMILYRTFLDPIEPGVREPVLDALAALSEVAQYLNDLADHDDDAARAQPSILHWYSGTEDFRGALWHRCLELLRARFTVLEELPDASRDASRDALCSMAFRVFKASKRLWATPGEAPSRETSSRETPSRETPSRETR